MTCCVGVIKGDVLSIAADRMVSNGFSHDVLQEPKVWQSGKMLIAACGSVAMLRLKYLWEPPQVNTWDIRKWAATTFMDSLPSDSWFVDEFKESSLLVGLKDTSNIPHLFTVNGYRGITQFNGKYAAIGSGMYTANGALIAMSELNQELSAVNMAQLAVKYSAEYTQSVGLGIDVATI